MEEKIAFIINDWVEKNKKFFWKYEISSFHKTYKISISHFPNPSGEDIAVSPSNGMSSVKKTQLSNAIKKACSKAPEARQVNVKVDYVDGTVVSAIV
jgi:hypothetical protein